MLKKSNILGVDYGDKRVGLAIVADGVAIPRLLPTLQNDTSLLDQLKTIAEQRQIERVVVGLPRSLSGDETAQTKTVRSFAKELEARLNLPVDFQDEALTSVGAEQTLKNSGGAYEKSDIDSLAASQILLDYIGESKN